MQEEYYFRYGQWNICIIVLAEKREKRLKMVIPT